MNTQVQTFIDPNTEFRVIRVWDSQSIADPNCAFALYIGDLTIHTNLTELERLYSTLDEFFSRVHEVKQTQAYRDRQAEMVSEVMQDQALSEGISLA